MACVSKYEKQWKYPYTELDRVMSLWILTGQFSTPNGKNLLQTAHIHFLLIKSVINKEYADSKNSKITRHKSTQNHTVEICKIEENYNGKNCYSIYNL